MRMQKIETPKHKNIIWKKYIISYASLECNKNITTKTWNKSQTIQGPVSYRIVEPRLLLRNCFFFFCTIIFIIYISQNT